MKAKKGFNLRNVCGEQIIVAEGKENIDFSNIISMNESSAYLWKIVQQRDSFTVEDMADLLLEEYDVERDTALADCKTLAQLWKNNYRLLFSSKMAMRSSKSAYWWSSINEVHTRRPS